MTDHIQGWDAAELVDLADVGVSGGRPGNRVAMCDQRGPEWLNHRRGCVTASNAGKIVGIKGQASKSTTRDTYLYQLAAETITRSVTDHHITAAMERGIELEPKARAWYVEHYRPVHEVGFVFRDADKREMGASPDGLCEDRGLEIKCLMPSTHCRLLRKMADTADKASVIPADYRLQVQFGMWITGLPLWDFVLYAPPILYLPSVAVTVEADAELHKCFDKVLPEFCAEVAAAVRTIKSIGKEGAE